MSTVFVAGAGTDIGKTALCVGLLEQLRRDGVPCSAYKPVATGFDPSACSDSDPGRLLAAQREPLTPANLDKISPWRFAAPLSPDAAARRENRSIDFDTLVRFCRGAAGDGVALIEGIGGVMVPLTERHTVLDWIVALGAPTLLVTGSYLGAISHALTAASVLSAAGARFVGIVVNQSEAEPMPTLEVAATLARFVPGIAVEIVGRAPPGAPVAVGHVWERLGLHSFRKRAPPVGETTGGAKR